MALNERDTNESGNIPYCWSLCLNSMEFVILKMIGRACQTPLSNENCKIGYIKELSVRIMKKDCNVNNLEFYLKTTHLVSLSHEMNQSINQTTNIYG